MLRLRDMGLARIRAQDKAGHASAETELRAIGPLLDLGRGHVVPPPAPVVPGDEDRNLWPESRGDDGQDLARGPRTALGDVSRAGGALGRRVGGMLAQRLVRVE